MLKPTWMFMDRMIAPIDVLSISENCLQNMTETHSVKRVFFQENQIFGSSCCSTREEFSINVSITYVRLILAKLMWFYLFSTSQNAILNFFGKKFKVSFQNGVELGRPFHWCINHNCKTDNDEVRVISFVGVRTDGYGQTDRHDFRIIYMETCRLTKNFRSKLKI